ncbi:class I SAM-dependent methyltransferase [Actinoplanes sp. RD1]|uniref:class I SAM-dependent methyltransferase n=1 Tax=Actinoplanes sp. RD1 TaxID=3064538 RepID=UPI0027423A6F|nr:class I SAM-dependent methyltransferase [Actinoplanes sp. RD1]
MSVTPDAAGELLTAAREALGAYFLGVTGTDEQVVRLPEGAAADLARVLAGRAGTVRQIVPCSGWQDADLFVLMPWRERAARGARVHRLYLVPYGNPDLAPVLRERDLDRDSRIDAHLLHLEVIPRAPVPMTHTWLIDEDVVVFEEHGDTGPAGWVVSRRPEDVRVAVERWQQLWSNRHALAHRPPHLAEPLLESADMLHSLAQVACTGHYVDPVSCAWYHGIWQYLRLFDMVSSPNWHIGFYSGVLREQLRGRVQPRVLITGAADYGMLACVLNAAGPGVAPDVHVLDVCLTPLLANRWYARRRGAEITTHNVDFVRAGEQFVAEQEPFDLIVSDAFLTRFPSDDAATVVENWRRLLRPGGQVVTTVRIYEEAGAAAGATLVTEYGMRLYERAKNSFWLLKIDFTELLSAAHHYAKRMRSSDQLGGADQVLDFLRRHGFEVVRSETATVAGELAGCDYLRIVCRVAAERSA